ncbi:MAG: helix-turn-helix domain-containing protein [Cohnella sp.]|nr:helix-turn-helix domain-containing protein [Cohnella sp.]
MFKSVTGVKLNEYITHYRLQKVPRYLKLYPHLTLTEIAERCGYASLNDLSRKIKRRRRSDLGTRSLFSRRSPQGTRELAPRIGSFPE